jgi:hypothetical protein
VQTRHILTYPRNEDVWNIVIITLCRASSWTQVCGLEDWGWVEPSGWGPCHTSHRCRHPSMPSFLNLKALPRPHPATDVSRHVVPALRGLLRCSSVPGEVSVSALKVGSFFPSFYLACLLLNITVSSNGTSVRIRFNLPSCSAEPSRSSSGSSAK